MVQRVLAIAIVLGTALALSGVFASATHKNDRPNISGIDAPDIALLESRPATAEPATEMAAEVAIELAEASGKFGIKPGVIEAAATAEPRPKMPAKIHFKPTNVTLGATGRKADKPEPAAGTDDADRQAARPSPTRVASATAASASTGAVAASAGKSADTGAAISVAANSGAAGATGNGGNGAVAASAAPTVLRTPEDTCMGSSGAAGQGDNFGFSVGTTWRDENCIMLKNARALLAQGDPKAAKIRLCMDEDNALAFEVVGEPCPRPLKSAQLAAAKLKAWNKGRTRSIVSDTRAAPAPADIQDFLTSAGNRVQFGFDQYKVTPDAAKTLKKQAAWLKRHAKVTAIIEGHADSRGPEKYNLALGERRAMAIRDYLIGEGVAPDRIKTISYGESRPAVQGETEAAWSQNRRGVTFLLNTDGAAKSSSLSAAPGAAKSTLAGPHGSAAADRSLNAVAPTTDDEIE